MNLYDDWLTHFVYFSVGNFRIFKLKASMSKIHWQRKITNTIFIILGDSQGFGRSGGFSSNYFYFYFYFLGKLSLIFGKFSSTRAELVQIQVKSTWICPKLTQVKLNDLVNSNTHIILGGSQSSNLMNMVFNRHKLL